LKGERWRLLRLAWLASTALAQSRMRHAASAEQLRGRRGQAQESGREWGLGQERVQTWACLHVTRSGEHECGDIRQARTGLQEWDEFTVIGILAHSLILCANHGVIQHGAAILVSQAKVSGHGECEFGIREWYAYKRIYRVLVVDGDQVHFEQGLDARQIPRVRIPHPDGDCALVGEIIGQAHQVHRSGLLPIVCCPVKRARVSEAHEIHTMRTCKVFLVELLPIGASV
jgi:hypothetical protein